MALLARRHSRNYGGIDMATIKSKILNLLTVKSIVTFALTAAFVYMALTDQIKPDIFMTIYTVVVGFYFGTQHEKNNQ